MDFSVNRPQYVKDTTNFKRYDQCNKDLNNYIHYFMSYERYRETVRQKFIKEKLQDSEIYDSTDAPLNGVNMMDIVGESNSVNDLSKNKVSKVGIAGDTLTAKLNDVNIGSKKYSMISGV